MPVQLKMRPKREKNELTKNRGRGERLRRGRVECRGAGPAAGGRGEGAAKGVARRSSETSVQVAKMYLVREKSEKSTGPEDF